MFDFNLTQLQSLPYILKKLYIDVLVSAVGFMVWLCDVQIDIELVECIMWTYVE